MSYLSLRLSEDKYEEPEEKAEEFEEREGRESEEMGERPPSRRVRTQTEKGHQYQLELTKKKVKSKRTELVDKIRAVLRKRGQSSDLVYFKTSLSETQILHAELKDLVTELTEFISPEEIGTIVNLDDTEEEWLKFESSLIDEIKHLEFIEQQKLELCNSSRRSSHGRSSRSNRHSKSSTTSSAASSMKFKLQQQEAALKVKLAFSEEERKLKLEQKKGELMKLEQEELLQQLSIKCELAQNQAMLDVCQTTERDNFEQNLDTIGQVDKAKDMERYFNSLSNSNHVSDEIPVDPIISSQFQQSLHVDHSHGVNYQSASPSVMEECLAKLVAATIDQIEVNRQLAVSSQLPKISIPVFHGDPLQYPAWSSSFNALIDSKPMDSQTKLNYLNQYVSGKPRQIVDQFILIGTEEAYRSAKALLQERYGNCNVIGSAFLNKLENWSKIGPKDAEALRDLSDFLQKILTARPSVPSLAVLDFAKENVKILAKLPYQIQTKFRSIVQQCRNVYGDGAYPSFAQFANFVKECAERANIPELDELSKTKEAVKSGFAKKGSLRGNNASAFSTRVPNPSQPPADQGQGQKGKPQACLYCREQRHLDECKKFSEMPLKERKNFFFKEKLCFGCASDSTHRIDSCENKRSCQLCKESHPTCLHVNKSPGEGHSKCTNVCTIPGQESGSDHAMIVPVWVRHASDPSKEFLQYAVLDDQSNVSFVAQSLCEKLNLQGPPTDLLLTTMQQRNVHVPSNRICGVEIEDYHRKHSVQLPMLFQQDEILSSRSQIPKVRVAREWEHLRPIADQLMPYDPDVEISLLIGNNCPRIVRPREMLVGGEDEPYGQRSLMGWGIIDKACQSTSVDDTSEGVCHKLIVDETNRHFAFSTKTKEVINPQNILRVLESDFVESSTRSKPYSVEDERFISILENGIVQRPDGHYEMPLPLKSEKLCLPFNRQLAVKRWHQLLARFKRNPKFLADYRAFMKDVIALCAERVPDDRLNVRDGKVNYVPHTGVYHPKKPEQIRVVFDCSAPFEGVSLNDHLLQGPDQMNTLLGILCRFRQENVAYMTDIKSMFHQFMVTEEHRDLLRFIWWEDGDPANDVIEYRIKVHLFGAGSSPGCASFGLKRAADDGEAEFGADAAEYIRKDFYVDDGLKSVPSPEEAITLLKASQGICAKAGLKLHKVMSNRREVLSAFPVEERAKSMKELDLKIDPLPIECVLGVTWCVENDSFQFRIELCDRPCTRRGILSTVSSIYDPFGYVAPVTLKGKQVLQLMCKEKLDWDLPISEELRTRWEKWRQDVLNLEKLQIHRCFKPENFGKVKFNLRRK